MSRIEPSPPGWKPWLLAARPKTLPAAVVPVWVGSMPALFLGAPHRFSLPLFLATLGSCLCIQIATNLFNDAIDARKGADTDARMGPVRATASGLLSRKSVMMGALVFCAVAALFATPLIAARGWPIVAIGFVSLLLAYGYTGGPVPLAYRGLGEVFVILFFGLVAVGGSWFVQTGELPNALIWVAAIQTGLYSTVLLAINNLRDIDEDRESRKRTLAVRLGAPFARAEIGALCLAPPLLGGLYLILDHPAAFLLPLPALVPGIVITRKVWRTEPDKAYNRFLALGALQMLVFAILLTVGVAL